ncbi:MAG: hypothetical protein FWE14_09455 [Lachnospiraceae bacterium]|nr:hypothetical protein [Lachnospiraceae bacterium]
MILNLNKLIKILDDYWKKIRSSKEDKIRPIIFMNTPISDESNDIIGLNSTVNSISYAINKKARMIGVIADYGSGKSSLTETWHQKKDLKKQFESICGILYQR